jgi:ribosomal protein S18 acetylase RimI-like enzyme
MPLYYCSGEQIQTGDYVLWHGAPAVIGSVADPAIGVESGVMVNPPMVFIEFALHPEGDALDFVARAMPNAGIAPAYTPITIADYDSVREILESTPGVVLRAADSRAAIERYLLRNPGLSLIARVGDRVAGCVLCGHDGRRGYLHHLAVVPEARRCGIANLLVEHCAVLLRRLGIDKIHADVLAGNELGHRFWSGAGWQRRDDVVRYSITFDDDPNA